MQYKLKYSRRKTIGIRLSPEEGIVVTAPFGCADHEIERVLEKKRAWIEKNLKEMEAHRALTKKKAKGQQILYLGKVYDIKISYSSLKSSEVRLSAQHLGVRLYVLCQVNQEKRQQALEKALQVWYRERAEELLSERTKLYGNSMGLSYNNITIKDIKTRWGSCSSKKNINYNVRLMLMPIDIIDYIVVHELCHLVYLNHSKEYWQLVEKHMPDYKEREKKLKALTPSVKAYWDF